MRGALDIRRALNAASPIEIEVAREAASSLAGAGRRVERALAALNGADAATRAAALAEASEAVWAWLIQREACGLRDHRLVLAEVQVPRAVMLRLGARR